MVLSRIEYHLLGDCCCVEGVGGSAAWREFAWGGVGALTRRRALTIIINAAA